MILKIFRVFLDKLLPWIYNNQLPDIKVNSTDLCKGKEVVLNMEMPKDYGDDLI